MENILKIQHKWCNNCWYNINICSLNIWFDSIFSIPFLFLFFFIFIFCLSLWNATKLLGLLPNQF